jgi:hypothetical protein
LSGGRFAATGTSQSTVGWGLKTPKKKEKNHQQTEALKIKKLPLVITVHHFKR